MLLTHTNYKSVRIRNTYWFIKGKFLNYSKWFGCACILVGARSKSGIAETLFIFKTANTVILCISKPCCAFFIDQSKKHQFSTKNEERAWIGRWSWSISRATTVSSSISASLLTTINRTPNTHRSTMLGNIVRTNTLYLGFILLSHTEPTSSYPYDSLHFICFVNKVY